MLILDFLDNCTLPISDPKWTLPPPRRPDGKSYGQRGGNGQGQTYASRLPGSGTQSRTRGMTGHQYANSAGYGQQTGQSQTGHMSLTSMRQAQKRRGPLDSSQGRL